MRTRFLPKMTNGEVEEYLNRNDIIFVPVGVVETHGGLPLDSETMISDAFAMKMAEKVDGLVLSNLPYFYAGGTTVGRGTVQMSIVDGINYLDKIAHSLLKQGFRRQIYLSLHGPANMTIAPVVRDFFEKTKVPILYIEMMKAMAKVKPNSFSENDFFDLIVGGYSLLGRLNEVPLNVPESDSQSYSGPSKESVENNSFKRVFSSLGMQACLVGSYFSKPSDHLSTPLIRSFEELEAHAEIGASRINEIVEAMDMPKIVDALLQMDKSVQNEILPKYGAWLP